MSDSLQGRRVAFLTANEGVEQVELTEPWKAVTEAGGQPELIAPEHGKVQAFNHLDKADQFDVDHTFAEIDLGDYDAIVLPGGVANPDQLRTHQPAVAQIRSYDTDRRPIAAICHGPWVLIEAGILRDRIVTSWPSLQTDIRNAGGQWVNEEVQVDGNLLTSRKPDDLPAFCRTLVQHVARSPRASAHSS